LVSLIQGMQGRGVKKLAITASSPAMKKVVEKMGWSNIPEKNPITGKEEKGENYLYSLDAKDGGVDLSASLEKFLCSRSRSEKIVEIDLWQAVSAETLLRGIKEGSVIKFNLSNPPKSGVDGYAEAVFNFTCLARN
jgi:hypothetical protein